MSSVPVIHSEPPRAVAVAEQGSITALLHLAVEKGTPVAELKELVALHEHMEKRQAQKAFAAALAAFQAECRSIQHNKTANIATKGGGKFSYTYASLDAIATEIAPLLAKHDLSYSWDTIVSESGAMLRCTCTVSHAAGHSVMSSISLPTASDSAMSAQQKVSAANKFARRLSLESALGLTTTDEAPEEEVDNTPITDDQLTVLTDFVNETGANLGRFLNFMGIVSLATLPARRFEYAMQNLRDMAKRRERAGQ